MAEEALKEEEPKPAKSTITAPVQTTVTYISPPVTQESPLCTENDNGATGSLASEINNLPPTSSLGPDPNEVTGPSVFPDSFAAYRETKQKIAAIRPLAKQLPDRPGKQTLNPSGVQPDQLQVHKPVDDPRNCDKLAGQDQGKTTDSYTATLQLPRATPSTKQEVLSTPQQQGEVSTTPRQEEWSLVHGQEEWSLVPSRVGVSPAPSQREVPPAPSQREVPLASGRRKMQPPSRRQEKRRKSRSTCGSFYYDPLLIMSGGQ